MCLTLITMTCAAELGVRCKLNSQSNRLTLSLGKAYTETRIHCAGNPKSSTLPLILRAWSRLRSEYGFACVTHCQIFYRSISCLIVHLTSALLPLPFLFPPPPPHPLPSDPHKSSSILQQRITWRVNRTCGCDVMNCDSP